MMDRFELQSLTFQLSLDLVKATHTSKYFVNCKNQKKSSNKTLLAVV